MTAIEFVKLATDLIGNVASVIASVVSGKITPIDGAAEIRRMSASLASNDAAIDDSVDVKFDKS